MKTNLLHIGLCIFIFSFNCKAQDKAQNIVGLWEITKVEVGNREMTPVAKWIRIIKNGNFQSGNGWLQNSEGSWVFDAENSTYLPEASQGVKDEFGAFEVVFIENVMTWKRMEDGIMVKVYLKGISKLPKSPADRIVGLWDLVDITKDGKSIIKSFDPEKLNSLFVRWDKRFIESKLSDTQLSGYWFMNAHKPELTLINGNDNQTESWKIEVSNFKLQMAGISKSNSNMIRIYKSIDEFPQ